MSHLKLMQLLPLLLLPLFWWRFDTSRWLGRFCNGGSLFVGCLTYSDGVGGEDDGHTCSRSLFNYKYNIKMKAKNIPLVYLEPHIFSISFPESCYHWPSSLFFFCSLLFLVILVTILLGPFSCHWCGTLVLMLVVMAFCWYSAQVASNKNILPSVHVAYSI